MRAVVLLAAYNVRGRRAEVRVARTLKPRRCETFLLRLGPNIAWDKLPKSRVYAVEEFRADDLIRPRSRFFTALGIVQLRERVEFAMKKGTLPSQVLVLMAVRKADLLDANREYVLRWVLRGVKSFVKKGDTEALREVRRVLDRKGTNRGPKLNPAKNRQTIDLLAKLAENRDLGKRHPHKKERLKSLVPASWTRERGSIELSRFCQNFYMECQLWGAWSPESWCDPYFADQLRAEFGFRFLDSEYRRHDLLAAREAYRRGKDAKLRAS